MLHSSVKVWMPVILLGCGIVVGYLNPQLGLPYVPLHESLLRWVLFFSVGIQGLWAFIGQTFYAEEVAASIGWPNSPFLFEVACCNLGCGIAGVAALWFGRDYWLALMLVETFFLWGAFYGHLKDALKSKNFAINNVGPIFYTDLFIPLILWVLFVWK